ncbi:PREDICTED: odorant receptor 4-like isoform X1 [Vollenhovia emeryi]|uniref:odorant receptor 4-like isoform X1 n=1 Tax=Vollenhovia emeryi TaxID=411798 RepID=UPI0005F4DA97|nr:PREDICTED: odorant receptor 4-like isoform X1 [Vollenhovia emeryi]
MKANTISQVTKIWLRIFGMWPDKSCVLLRRLFWFVMLVVEQILQYRYVIMRYHLLEFSEIMNVLSSVMTYTVFLIKVVIFWYKQRTFNRILTMMAIDLGKSSSTKFSMFATMYNVKLSQRFANMTVIIYSTAVTFFSFSIVIKRVNDDTASNVSTRLLILEMDLPFDTSQRFVYESVIIVQFLYLLLCADANGLLNALLINLVLHASGQINILRKSLMEIFTKKGESSPNQLMIKKLIRKHQKIIIFSEQIEDLYSYIAMVLFVSDTVITCCLGVTIVASIGQPDAWKSILRNLMFYFVMNMEAFIFCFAGEYLSAKSKSIGDAAYDSLWYESGSRDSRSILFLIMRSQNQLTITIGKIMNLSLERFSSIIKASGSYISVLLAMY